MTPDQRDLLIALLIIIVCGMLITAIREGWIL